jgi:predicted dehydrogenase
MARAAGSLHTAIGLQGRLNPAVRRAAQLISSGKIGRPFNARICRASVGFGPELPSSHDYFNKTSSGANLLTISAGHTLDLAEAVLGPIIEIDARTEILWPAVKLTDTGEESLRETADYVAAARREAVDRARQSWIRKLIDLSRRNNLLYYRMEPRN